MNQLLRGFVGAVAAAAIGLLPIMAKAQDPYPDKPIHFVLGVAPGGFFDVRGVKLPVGVSAFAEEIYQAPKSWSQKAYVKLAYYGRHPVGTHFAAWEQPALFVSDVRSTFKNLRS